MIREGRMAKYFVTYKSQVKCTLCRVIFNWHENCQVKVDLERHEQSVVRHNNVIATLPHTEITLNVITFFKLVYVSWYCYYYYYFFFLITVTIVTFNPKFQTHTCRARCFRSGLTWVNVCTIMLYTLSPLCIMYATIQFRNGIQILIKSTRPTTQPQN